MPIKKKKGKFITTFSTNVGLHHYKRLLFGVNNATKIFQNATAELLRDFPGGVILSNNIIIQGKTQTDHDCSLRATLQKLANYRAELNKVKRMFSTHQLTLYSYVFFLRKA